MKSKTKILAKILIAFSLTFLIASCDKSLKKVKDIDGNEYDVVKIGDQCWLKQNLKTSTYNDGTPIKKDQDVDWANGTIGAYAIYKDSTHPDKIENNKIYGKLYNWYAVNTGNLAPKGWHVATDADWDKLDKFLGHANAGIKLKAKHSWQYDKEGAGTDETGFSALAAGTQAFGGSFSWFMGQNATFWTWKSTALCTDDNIIYPISYAMTYNVLNITQQKNYKPNFGMSVRCVKD